VGTGKFRPFTDSLKTETQMIESAMFGTLSRDAEVKTSKAGKTYLRINLRVGDGDEAQFVNAMIFDTTAIETADKLTKGAGVYLEGKLSVDEWTGKDGAKRHGISIMSSHCRLAQIGRNKPKREKSTSAASPYAPSGTDLDDEIPF
jgi:single-stranded DNA-binding protein